MPDKRVNTLFFYLYKTFENLQTIVKERLRVVYKNNAGRERGKGNYKKAQSNFGVITMFIILIVMIVSWVYTYVKTHYILNFIYNLCQ